MVHHHAGPLVCRTELNPLVIPAASRAMTGLRRVALAQQVSSRVSHPHIFCMLLLRPILCPPHRTASSSPAVAIACAGPAPSSRSKQTWICRYVLQGLYSSTGRPTGMSPFFPARVCSHVYLDSQTCCFVRSLPLASPGGVSLPSVQSRAMSTLPCLTLQR
jgi:hypothetical protein